MLKPDNNAHIKWVELQPPSGGCVLKLGLAYARNRAGGPAAFGRLCVETLILQFRLIFVFPAAFGRLCVETFSGEVLPYRIFPAAFGRLCVETSIQFKSISGRLPAAFGRLCVETWPILVL